MRHEVFLRSLYGAFNSRNIGAVLASMTSDVDWPNGWQGGRVVGQSAVRDYWERQWAAIDPSVEPVNIMQRSDGKVEVTVHQIVRNRSGSVLSDEEVRHTYTFRGGLIERMTNGDDGGADETVGWSPASPSR
ncbi:MAG: nuclear transport factor 2 family protein [Acidimicrobiales bacterium]